MSGFEQLIERYEAIASVTQQMREAAVQENWEGLLSMQEAYVGLVELLRPSDIDIPLSEQQRARKLDVIRRILDDDAKIRDRVDPRLARLSALLASGRQTRALQGAYGVAME